MIAALEKELVRLTKVKAKGYKDRQDFMAAVVRAVNKVDDETFDLLTDQAVVWFNAAVRAIDSKHTIPEFDEPLEDGNDELDGDESGETAEAEGADAPDDAGTAESTVHEDDDRTEPEVGPVGNVVGDEPVPDDDVPEVKAKKPRKPKRVENTTVTYAGNEIADLIGDDGMGLKDKFGIIIGTKSHKAVKMHDAPEGATMKEVTAALGGTHGNILKAVAKRGHLVEKMGGGRYRVTHKDELKNGKRAEGK